MIQKENNSLYVHIPFCNHICAYCDFTKLLFNEKFASNYLEALFFEIDSYKLEKMDTIYVGGGTPTSLSDEHFELLMKKLSSFLKEDCEFTVEANVENLTENKLILMKKYSVNRLSIGIESTDDKMLTFLNRHHSFEEAKRVVNLAKNYIKNINVDLIYGLPNETINDLKRDLENILSLKTNHISIYSLSINEGSMLKIKGFKEQNEDESRICYDLILKELRASGYTRYEVSNFCLDGFESKHNLGYWRNHHYFGVGLGASGYINNLRYTNTKSLTNYCAHDFIDYKENISNDDYYEYYLMLNLRLEEGFSRDEFKNLFGYDFIDSNLSLCRKLKKEQLLNFDDKKVALTDAGLMILDTILLKFLK